MSDKIKVVEVEKLKAAIEKAWLELPNSYIGDDPQYLHMDKIEKIIDSLAVEREPVETNAIDALIELVHATHSEQIDFDLATKAREQIEALKARLT